MLKIVILSFKELELELESIHSRRENTFIEKTRLFFSNIGKLWWYFKVLLIIPCVILRMKIIIISVWLVKRWDVKNCRIILEVGCED